MRRETNKITSGSDLKMRAMLGGMILLCLVVGGLVASVYFAPVRTPAEEDERATAAVPESVSLFDARDAAAVRRMVESGAKVDERNSAGETPLMCAANEGNAEVMRALIAAGADLTAQTPDYRGIFEFATTDEIRHELLAAGAKDPDNGVENADPLPADGGEPWKVVIRMLAAIQENDETTFHSLQYSVGRNAGEIPGYLKSYPPVAVFHRGTTNGKRAIVYGTYEISGQAKELYAYLALEDGQWKIVSHAADVR
jgi:uncharacterized protein